MRRTRNARNRCETSGSCAHCLGSSAYGSATTDPPAATDPPVEVRFMWFTYVNAISTKEESPGLDIAWRAGRTVVSIAVV